jgi:hypothetical protein
MTGAGSSSGDWGPWIEHDGAAPVWKGSAYVEMEWIQREVILKDGFSITWDYPGFFWRWQTVRTGWFRKELRRVCDDLGYGPILRYRIRRPPAVCALIDLVENLPAPAQGDRVLS